jgi:eukaryotic-like serine/threonine-protein kinase
VAKVAAEVGSTANSYQILAKLAVGGMAEIFLARGASVAGVERYCVLKRILRERAADAQFAQMFLDEARLAAQLQHPNIAAVYDIGMLGDSYFFTMEYVHGETVRLLLQRARALRRSVPLACALTIIAGAAAGLHHAHERNATDGRPLGIVHRDVSPSNLMVSYEGNVKVVDFGVAKAANRAVETHSGTVKGKISYLSPEQCRGAQVDRRSDLFSLGIVMWELLTGARLYRRDGDFESMTAIVHETPSPPSRRRAEVPRAVDDIALRLLAKSVDDRFQTAAEVVEAIENASMRAGTILSTSAVARLVRDLFGVRAEPWLELERDTLPLEPLSFIAQPIPTRSAATPSDELELGLARILDLSNSSVVVEIADDNKPPLPAARPVKVFGPASVPTLIEAFVPAPPPSEPEPPPSTESALAAITARAPAPVAAAPTPQVAVPAAMAAIAVPPSAPVAVPPSMAALAALGGAAGPPPDQPWSSTLLGVGAPKPADPPSAVSPVPDPPPDPSPPTSHSPTNPVSPPTNPVSPPIAASPTNPVSPPAARPPAKPASPPASAAATNTASAAATNTVGEPASPPTRKRGPCDAMNVEDMLRQAALQYNSGYAKAALALVLKALTCKQDPRMHRLAVTYACAARDLPTAKRYFVRVPRENQSGLEQKCQLEGLNVRAP